MPAAHELDFLVQRRDLRKFEFAESSAQAEMGELLIYVEKFAFTANNVTYGVFGESMNYWRFFPYEGETQWGRIPVWGYGEVLESRIEEIHEGERIYGYLPMSTHVNLLPERISAHGFMDGSEHRRALPAAYQQYTRLAADPLHDARYEDYRAILHPLYFTSFLIEDFLADNQLFGASQVVVASASSKTAAGVAFLLSKKRPFDARVIGLTSARNKAFCEKLGYYDEVVLYEDLAKIDATKETVYVDMAGNGALLSQVHHHFSTGLRHSCIVGATHWEERATQHAMPGVKPQFFFAPAQMAKRMKEWGGDVFRTRFGEAWKWFLPSVSGWLEIRHGRGPDAVRDTYLEVLEGRSAPQVGHILSLK